MIQIITREWRIVHTYIHYEKILRNRIISLSWNDFQTMAEKYSLLMAVKVEENKPVKEIAEKAIEEIRKHLSKNVSALIFIIYHKKGDILMMEELCGINDCWEDFPLDDMETKWGLA